MEKERIFYILGTDWEWIYQRPQIFAEKLTRDYDVTVLFARSIVTRNTKLPNVPGMNFRILWTIPYQEKNTLIGKISAVINAKLFEDIDNFQYIYVGYPQYSRYIPAEYQGKIIYDCMDNHEAMYPDQKRVHKILKLENALIKKCDLLVVSAKLLQEKMDAIAGSAKSILIRNGGEIEELCDIKQPVVKHNYSLCCIGTIAEWFDYDVIQDSLNVMQNIDYQLIGPVIKKVQHSKIVYHGQQPHEYLRELVKDYDCLIMPFQVNEIVRSVDPVKLYEYIAFGKCIISVYYPEIERFKDFVYFYETGEEYIELLKRLVEEGFPPKYNSEQQKAFLQENTWDTRYTVLKNEIEKMAME